MDKSSNLVRIRERYEVTIPKELRDALKIVPGDYIGFDFLDNGKICVHKIIPRRMRNRSNNQPKGENEGG